MQFKRQANRIQVLVYDGYDKQRKRAIVKMIGSLDATTFRPNTGFFDGLTDEQKQEILSYIKEQRQSNDIEVLQSAIKTMVSRTDMIPDALTDDLITSDEYAGKIWAAIGLLSKQLKQTGHPKPTRRKG